MKRKSYVFLSLGIRICMLKVLIGAALETVFNLLGLWVAWNLFGYLFALIIIPISISTELILTLILVIKFCLDKRAGSAVEKKTAIILPFVFIAVTIFIVILSYTILFTWKFQI